MKYEYRYILLLQTTKGDNAETIELKIYASYQSIADKIYIQIKPILINLDCYPTEVN